MQTERIDLYYQQGSSDKVYHLQLENVEGTWSVNAQWGRRGSSLQSDTKASGVPYEEAKRVFDRVLREKTGKGYRVAESERGRIPGYFGWDADEGILRSCTRIADSHRGTGSPRFGPESLVVVSTEVRRTTPRRSETERRVFGHQQTRPDHSHRQAACGDPRSCRGRQFSRGRRDHRFQVLRVGHPDPQRMRPARPALRNPLCPPDAASFKASTRYCV